MSFLEWWGESVDPGKVGTIDTSGEHEVCRCKALVVARFAFVVMVLPVAWYFAIQATPMPLLAAAAAVVGGTLIYVGVAYLFHPQPDADNLGWACGMVDHPWRISDDMNRFLLLAKIVLGPGRFVAESLFDMLHLIREEDRREEEA